MDLNTLIIIKQFIFKKETKTNIIFIDNGIAISYIKDIASKYSNYFTNTGQSVTQGIKYESKI